MQAAIGAGLSIAGSVMGGKAADKAKKQQMQMMQQAQQYNKEMIGKGETMAQPWIEGGQKSYNAFLGASGALGAEQQQQFFDNFTGGPYASAMRKNLEDSLTSAAAARGSAYGGNFYNALYQGNANLYNDALNNQMNWLQQGIQPGMQAMGNVFGLYGQGMSSNTQLTGQGMDALGSWGKAKQEMWNNIGNTAGKTFSGMSIPGLS